MATNIGMMDSAYFVGRSEILAWINSTLQLNLSKVEEVILLSNFVSEFGIGSYDLIRNRWILICFDLLFWKLNSDSMNFLSVCCGSEYGSMEL